MTRIRCSSRDKQHDPLIFCVPLLGRWDDTVDEVERDLGGGTLLFNGAMKKLREIVRPSDEGTQGVAAVAGGGKGTRVRWWAERAKSDKRMKLLLDDIQFCWLGAFKVRFEFCWHPLVDR